MEQYHSEGVGGRFCPEETNRCESPLTATVKLDVHALSPRCYDSRWLCAPAIVSNNTVLSIACVERTLRFEPGLPSLVTASQQYPILARILLWGAVAVRPGVNKFARSALKVHYV